MKVSFNWLKNYLELDHSPEKLAEMLTLVGLEVESVETFGTDFNGFVVGEVIDVRDHPNADKLTLCRVNLGKDQVQIVCGADNVAAGQKVPVAVVGTKLPSGTGSKAAGMEIKKVKLRGEISEGMICSESELGIGDDHSGIMVMDSSLKAGIPLHQALGIETDTVFDIGLTPNRPDAACHIGVARDLGAVLKKQIDNPCKESTDDSISLDEKIQIEIKETDKCKRYVGKIVTDIKVDESPAWLKNRLLSIGLRPINNVVDATNYILHETGQPLHAFDYDKLEEKRIVVKSFEKEISFRTLDGIERKVAPGTLFICNGEKPVAIAGIMGGEESEVVESTQSILLESAWFEPSFIRRSSRALGLQTDSSYRFERGVDPNLANKACERAANLIAEITGGTILDGSADIYPSVITPWQLSLRIDRLNSLLGMEVDPGEAEEILNLLEIETDRSDRVIDCTIPTFRPDLTREVDLIEEVGRILDYNTIPEPESAPFFSPAPLSSWEIIHSRVRSLAAGLRFKEISTNSLISKNESELEETSGNKLQTLNPVSNEATHLRSSLLPGFLKSVAFNLNRKANTLRFFEIGHVFRSSEDGTWISGIEEHSRLLLGICGYRQKGDWRGEDQPYTIFDLKADLESFFQQLGILSQLKGSIAEPNRLEYQLNGQKVATLSKVVPELLEKFNIELPLFAAEIDLTLIHQSGLTETETGYRPPAKYPTFEYDAAYVVPTSEPAGRLLELIRKSAGKNLHRLEVFDIYEGENLGKGKKSIAFRLTFLDRNKTLNINDVEPVVQKVTKVLENEAGAKLRS